MYSESVVPSTRVCFVIHRVILTDARVQMSSFWQQYSSKPESAFVIKGKRSQCLISEGVQCVWERDKQKRKAERWRGRERWYHMTLKTSGSPISCPDKRKFEPKQADRHSGWNFPITQAWKEINFLSFKTENEYFLVVKQVKSILFIWTKITNHNASGGLTINLCP